jgi:hypothetical protein
MSKVKIEMELHDVLRISVLLDHYRAWRAGNAERGNEASPEGILNSNYAGEAATLNETLLKAISRKSPT